MALPFFYFSLLSSSVLAQNIATTTPLPPLQWINLTNLLQGTSRPPPLKDAAIGYDERSRSLIIFGGVSESGFPQSQTFLLDLDTLTWSTPTPPSTLQRTPPARSAAVSGSDFAASNRHGFVIIGGKGSEGQPLSDIWEYDFNNQFWSAVELSTSGPSARWGASGGIDIRVPPVQDPVVPGPNNTIYFAGGFDGTNADPLSDVWRLHLSGTLSSNLPDSVGASWDRVRIGTLPGRISQAGTVVGQQVISAGGCDSSSPLSSANISCALQDSFIVDVQRQTAIPPGSCPPPRVGPVMVPNLNSFSSSFASQAFLLLGIFNTSLWQDSDGLTQGEVAVLDTNTATWTRVLPSGDPNSSGRTHFPTPRQGAAAASFSEALVGNSRSSSSDTIIFGGQDANGNYLSDVWLLRAYRGVLSSSSPIWSGFGNGQLQTGISADGSGVRVNYLTECATAITQPRPTTANPTTPPASTSTGSDPLATPQTPVNFHVSFLHKLLLPLSVVVLMPVMLFFRWTFATSDDKWKPRIFLVSIFTVFGLLAYGLGIAGLVFAFSTVSSSQSDRSPHLKTRHGVSGVIFFACLYLLVPLSYLFLALLGRRSSIYDTRSLRSSIPLDPTEKVEPALPPARSATPSIYNTPTPSSPRLRTQSWDASNLIRPSIEGGMSSDTTPPATPHRAFEVLNRPNRSRRLSAPWPATANSAATSNSLPSRNLGEIDWLLRRRSLNRMGELDYAITQVHNAQVASRTDTPAQSNSEPRQMIQYPKPPEIFFHLLIQVSVLALSIISLTAIWSRAPRYLFALLLVWTIGFYAFMLALSWSGRPADSILTAALWRLRGKDLPPGSPFTSNSEMSKLAPGQNPYTHHRPPFRPSTQVDELPHALASPTEADDDDDDDIDDETRQRLIEEEMERRDVSVITVPRRKLQIANPS
ncbi:unnamed protein product [Cyclocybe aegerita]|uniref:Uncharacterized protein n=1 Tax=Cyclocybe aegerita TaxID=1973307 RepID=A0A8S0XEC0_CYCAE|nr:unnamed protein product [Cyclocybe aegerita]